ncbi:hypothetical protein [Granulicoccus sp. GXG6511]|uniref:hypothetical protein n=1 Tax=Granulicoccus sp. GXG6511 TaxID=3381351 RepID=UPI003D7D035B
MRANGRLAPLAPFNGYGWFVAQVSFASLMTVGHWPGYDRQWPVVLAVLLSGVVAGVPLSARWARTFVGGVAALGWLAIMALVGSQVSPPVGELSVLWPATSASLAMGLLAMIGMWRLAWTATLLLIVQGLLWGMTRDLAPAIALEQAGLLTAPVAGTVYRILMRNARFREAAARREEAAALEQIGRMASQAEARREYRARLQRQVGPILERISAGDELTADERKECRLTEASLRDAIRGRGLATREVSQAARAARERGATVSLIDDRRVECVDEVCRNVLAATRDTLESAEDGDTFVARLLPLGRRNVATVLLRKADGEGVRREFTMPPSGDPADGAFERPPVELTG